MSITSKKENQNSKKSLQIFDTNIIKKKLVEIDEPISIGGEQQIHRRSSSGNNVKDTIEPIIENDEIVGVVHHCSCGKATEIRFDY